MADINPKSTAKLMGHPIHPMLVGYPIAFLTGALLSDIAYWQLGDTFWAQMSRVLLAAGILTALAAALAGFTDFLGDRRIRALSHAWQHMLGNLLALLVAIGNFSIRLGDPEAAIIPLGLLLSLATGAILGFTGWRGGDLIYRHRVGIPDRKSEPV